MSNIINLPKKSLCHVCGTSLRRASKNEILKGINRDDPNTRQIFVHGVQGDISKKVIEPGILLDSLEIEMPTGSWVMICDSCGLIEIQAPSEIF